MRDTDRKRFNVGLDKLLYATNGTARVPRHVQDTYWRALEDYLVKDVERAIAGAIKEQDRHVTPAHLIHRIDPTTSERNSKNPAVVAQREQDALGLKPMRGLADMSDFERMQMSAYVAFSQRCCGKAPEGMPVYQGPFDFLPAVHAASLPAAPGYREHLRAWDGFRALLSEEWELWKSSPGATSAP